MWIFGDDYDGCVDVLGAINLDKIIRIHINSDAPRVIYFAYEEDEIVWPFKTPEQAYTAFSSIRKMLKK